VRASDRTRRAPIAPHGAEAGAVPPPQIGSLARDELAENLRERDTAPSRLSLEEGQVVAFSGYRRSPKGHASAATSIADRRDDAASEPR